MKIRAILRKAKVSGTVLAYALGVATIIGMGLVGYLTLVSNEGQSTQRSQAWNACIAVVEAGLEEGLAHLNSAGATNLGTQYWALSGSYYEYQRDIESSYYIARISMDDPPRVRCTGYVPLPLCANRYVSRTVECQTGKQPRFSKALLAEDGINLRGNNINTDSFISTDADYSTDGQYDPTKRRDHGDVATNSSLTNAFNVGNANIAGHISTGPGGSAHLGPNGTVGDVNWVGTTNGIQPGYVSDDMNVSLVDVDYPFPPNSGVNPIPGTVNGTNYSYVLGTDNYTLSVLENANVYVEGHATLLVTDTIKQSKGGIIIGPGASLTLYMAGQSASIGGNGIINLSTNALAFQYYGLPSNTSVSLSGNATFTGCIYAPNADLTMGGGGSTAYDVTGSVVAKTITMNGNFNVHYDEALLVNGPVGLYIATTWNEL